MIQNIVGKLSSDSSDFIHKEWENILDEIFVVFSFGKNLIDILYLWIFFPLFILIVILSSSVGVDNELFDKSIFLIW